MSGAPCLTMKLRPCISLMHSAQLRAWLEPARRRRRRPSCENMTGSWPGGDWTLDWECLSVVNSDTFYLAERLETKMYIETFLCISTVH